MKHVRFSAIALSAVFAFGSITPAGAVPVLDVWETYKADQLEDDGIVSRVPWIGSGPSYEETFDDGEKRKVYEMARLAGDVYHDGKARASGCYGLVSNPVEGYLGDDSGFSVDPDKPGQIVLDGLLGTGKLTGFDASIYEAPDGSIVLAFRGTESGADGLTDLLQLASSITPAQYEAASRLLHLLLENNPGKNITVVGHSLGGALAQYAMIDNDLEGRVKGYTFNSAGLANDNFVYKDRERLEDAGRNLVNVRNDGDPVSAVRYHVGTIYDVENDTSWTKAHSLGDEQGPDENGNPVYDGLIGNLQRDAGGSSAAGGCPCGSGCKCEKCPERRKGDDGTDGGTSGPGDAGGTSGPGDAGGTSGPGESDNVGGPEGTAAESDGLCPCTGSAEKRKELAKAEKLLRNAENRRGLADTQADGAWWNLLAVALEPFPGLMEKAGGAVAGPWGEEAIKTVNRAAQMYFDGEIDVKKLATSVLESLKIGMEKTLTASDKKSSWWKWICHPIDTISGWVDKLEGALEYGQELGDAIAGVVAARDKLRQEEQILSAARKRLDDFLSENGDGGKGGCFCGPGCRCVHCVPPEETPELPGNPPSGGSNPVTPPEDEAPANPPGGTGGTGGPGTNPGTSGPTGPQKPENPYEGWFVYEDPGDGRDPWAPILSAVKGDQAGAKDAPGLLDVIGMGSFDDILVDANKIAGWAFEAGQYAGVAENIWGAFTDGGENTVAMAETIGNAVVAQVENWLEKKVDKIIGKLTAWANARLDVIVAKMEAITDPINGKLDDINERIRKWLAVDVTKWLETMKTYADGLDTPDTDDRGWSVVDYGFDAGGVGTDAQNRGRTLRGRGKRQIYEESLSP